MVKIIGIGEYAISDDTSDVLKTFALSSCVALVVYSRIKKILGMVHIALPNSGIMQNGVIENPGYYADTAVSMLIRKACFEYGCTKEELELRLFGGAQSIREGDVFKIGIRNIEMVLSVLSQMNLKICFYDTGGKSARSIEAEVATGTVKVAYQPLSI
jgi:chemotaxis protein CheD